MVKSSNIRNKYDLHDISRILGVSYITAAKLCRDGEIKSTKIAQKWYVEKRDLNEYMDTGNIFQKPQKVILDVISKAIKEATEKNIGEINQAIQLTFKNNLPWLAYRVKELIISDLNKVIQGNLKKIEQNNVRSTEFETEEKTAERIRKTEKIKKDFEEAKQM